jgi:hypothetical protein
MLENLQLLVQPLQSGQDHAAQRAGGGAQQRHLGPQRLQLVVQSAQLGQQDLPQGRAKLVLEAHARIRADSLSHPDYMFEPEAIAVIWSRSAS